MVKKSISIKTKYFKLILTLIIFVILTYFIYLITIFNQSNNKLYIYNDLVFKEFYANSPYADVKFKANDKFMYVTVKYKNLNGVSAIHIHVNQNGNPGPVLAWLGTTVEWQRGVAQTSVNGNNPCCNKNNIKCILASPANIGTPYLNNQLKDKEQTFIFHNDNIKEGKCPWIKNGTFLDIHGFNFQQIINGQLTKGKPSADIIYQQKFTLI